MDFIDRLRELSARLSTQLPHIQTEEATKNALVMPFIAALGYDVFNPLEVTPELNADIGIKKGEKVDYAILKDGKPILLWECKHHAADLSKEHCSQLYRYFSVTEARFGVLTNGIQFWFYTDLDAPNKMDSRPFFEFSLADIRDQDVEELKKFAKSSFNVDGILTAASELKYTREIKRIMAAELQEPTDDFVKFFAGQIIQGRMNQAVKGQFTQAVRRALNQFINEQINLRLKSVLSAPPVMPEDMLPPNVPPPQGTPNIDEPAVVTTLEETEAFYIVRAIVRDLVDVRRIVMRDVESYCGILLDDNNRKPICRLYFNSANKRFGIFDNAERTETKIGITTLDDIYKVADRLRATVELYKQK